MSRRSILILSSLLITLVLIAWIRVIIGTSNSTRSPQWGIPSDELILNLRLSRVWVGVLVGSCLGVAGVLLQSLLRNPLAAPDLMGLSAGAGFAVTLVIFITGASLSVGTASIPALAGALLVLMLVYTLSQRHGVIDPVTMVLIGVIVSVILGAATMLVASQMPDRGFGTSRWMMGHIREDLAKVHLWSSSAIAALVMIYALTKANAYDTGALSTEEAQSVGLRLKQIRLGQLIGAGVLTTVSIVLAGPIAFVGLVSPHLVRMLIGPQHKTLLIGSAIVGASMVVGADVVTRLIQTDAGRIPIGVLTSLIGGPVFLMLLLKERATR
ncbi:MAG: FecCD family ABC transporter permease [Phycisphaerales bacterium]